MNNKGILGLILVMAAAMLALIFAGGFGPSSASAADCTTVVTPTPAVTPGPGVATVGIDFLTTDNTSTTVGTIVTCLEVASGATYTLDVYVQNVPGDTDPTTPDGMVAGQYTLNSISGNTDTSRTATAGFIDTGTGIAVPGGAAVDNTASSPVGGSTGSDTIVASNDPYRHQRRRRRRLLHPHDVQSSQPVRSDDRSPDADGCDAGRRQRQRDPGRCDQ
jgi:hypothetical protein